MGSGDRPEFGQSVPNQPRQKGKPVGGEGVQPPLFEATAPGVPDSLVEDGVAQAGGGEDASHVPPIEEFKRAHEQGGVEGLFNFGKRVLESLPDLRRRGQ